MSSSKEAWDNFVCKVRGDFDEEELASVSLSTLHELLKHYGTTSAVESARVEIYWRVLSKSKAPKDTSLTPLRRDSRRESNSESTPTRTAIDQRPPLSAPLISLAESPRSAALPPRSRSQPRLAHSPSMTAAARIANLRSSMQQRSPSPAHACTTSPEGSVQHPQPFIVPSPQLSGSIQRRRKYSQDPPARSNPCLMPVRQASVSPARGLAAASPKRVIGTANPNDIAPHTPSRQRSSSCMPTAANPNTLSPSILTVAGRKVFNASRRTTSLENPPSDPRLLRETKRIVCSDQRACSANPNRTDAKQNIFLRDGGAPESWVGVTGAFPITMQGRRRVPPVAPSDSLQTRKSRTHCPVNDATKGIAPFDYKGAPPPPWLIKFRNSLPRSASQNRSTGGLRFIS
ncbi:hypothetical protein DIPPA_61500 [Diplonema papillatum]|nr:hypothetical protein DIPPA_61500 [Diplonema papillatum]